MITAGCLDEPIKPLRIGTNVWVGYETLYLARNLGCFDNAAVKLVELPSATEVSHAFRNHTLEVATLTLDESLTLLQSETDIRVILVIDFSHGGDVLLTNPAIDSLEKLRGKRIGVENTAVGAVLLDGALTAASLTPKDIDIIPMTVDEHRLAYLAGEVDGVVTFDPIKSQLLNSGAINLFDSSRIPERIVDVMITRQQVIERRADDLAKLLTGYFKALAFLKRHPIESARRIAPRLGLSSSELLPQYSGIRIPDLAENRQLLDKNDARLKPNITRLADIMYRKKLLFKPVNIDTLLDDSLLPPAS